MGLRGDAAVVGWAEWESERKHAGARAFQLEQWADLAALALADAGIAAHEVNGLVCCDLRESTDFVPATIAELSDLIRHDFGGRITRPLVVKLALGRKEQ